MMNKQISYTNSFPILGGRESTTALQSSPYQNPGGGVNLSLTEKEYKGRTEIIVSNFGWFILKRKLFRKCIIYKGVTLM